MNLRIPGKILIIGLFFFGLYGLAYAQPDAGIPKKEEGKVAASPQEICPLLVGDSVPELTLATIDGGAFNLNDAIKKKPTVLIFYRGGW